MPVGMQRLYWTTDWGPDKARDALVDYVKSVSVIRWGF